MAEPSLAIHPTQIYESAASFAIAALLILYVHGRKRYDGQIFLAFVALYAAVRFGLEFLRNDDRGGLGGEHTRDAALLSTSQLIGILLIVAVLAGHRYLSQRVARAAKPA
jgi:phosphatidylglycerol:prolipoprotein diacylglycerol transferase